MQRNFSIIFLSFFFLLIDLDPRLSSASQLSTELGISTPCVSTQSFTHYHVAWLIPEDEEFREMAPWNADRKSGPFLNLQISPALQSIITRQQWTVGWEGQNAFGSEKKSSPTWILATRLGVSWIQQQGFTPLKARPYLSLGGGLQIGKIQALTFQVMLHIQAFYKGQNKADASTLIGLGILW